MTKISTLHRNKAGGSSKTSDYFQYSDWGCI